MTLPTPSPDQTSAAVPAVVRAWHALVERPDAATLRGMLAPTVVFRSPAVHAPQAGPELTFAYLWAATQVLGPTLRYHQEWYAASSAVLEFSATLDGRDVHGVDLIRWDDHDRIVEFTVMARPLRGLEALIAQMAAALQRGAASGDPQL